MSAPPGRMSSPGFRIVHWALSIVCDLELSYWDLVDIHELIAPNQHLRHPLPARQAVGRRVGVRALQECLEQLRFLGGRGTAVGQRKRTLDPLGVAAGFL